MWRELQFAMKCHESASRKPASSRRRIDNTSSSQQLNVDEVTPIDDDYMEEVEKPIGDTAYSTVISVDRTQPHLGSRNRNSHNL